MYAITSLGNGGPFAWIFIILRADFISWFNETIQKKIKIIALLEVIGTMTNFATDLSNMGPKFRETNRLQNLNLWPIFESKKKC